MDLLSGLQRLDKELEKGLGQVFSWADLEQLRVDFLGRKGRRAQLRSQLSGLSPEERPAVGQMANEIKTRLLALLDGHRADLVAHQEAAALARFDASPPGRTPWSRPSHPTTLAQSDTCSLFYFIRFEVVSGS